MKDKRWLKQAAKRQKNLYIKIFRAHGRTTVKLSKHVELLNGVQEDQLMVIESKEKEIEKLKSELRALRECPVLLATPDSPKPILKKKRVTFDDQTPAPIFKLINSATICDFDSEWHYIESDEIESVKQDAIERQAKGKKETVQLL